MQVMWRWNSTWDRAALFVVAAAALALSTSRVDGQYTADFEAPAITGSAAGDILTGQDDYYIPAVGGTDFFCYTYAGNTPGIDANPTGGDQFIAGSPDGVTLARAQRDIVYGDGTGAWTVAFDVCATYTLTLPAADFIGSVSTQILPGEATFIHLLSWVDPATATLWNAEYAYYNAAGEQIFAEVPVAGFNDLEVNHWYRWSTTFDLDSNLILSLSIEDLETGAVSTYSPALWYLGGGSAGAPAPSGLRFFGGGVDGNLACYDNLVIEESFPVADLACTSPLEGVIEATWTNRGAYDEVQVYVNGTLDATIAGPLVDGAAETFTSATYPVPQSATLSVRPVLAGIEQPDTACLIALLAEPAAEDEADPDVDVSSALPPYFGVFVFSSPAITIEDVQVEVDITHPFLGFLDVSMTSAAGTAITLHDQVGTTAVDINTIYWQLGIPNAAPYDCSCLMQPSGPGALSDFVNETHWPGAWIVAVIASSADVGTVNHIGILIFDEGPAFPATGLACAQGVVGTIDATWTHAANYDEVNIYVNGALETTLAGPFTAGDAGSYTTSAQPIPSNVQVCVEGVKDGLAGPQACCTAPVFIEPITGFGSYAAGGTGEIQASWTNGATYDAINVYIDGAFVEAIGGTETSYTSGPNAVPGTAEICVEGEIVGLGLTVQACTNVMLLEAADTESCDTPALVLPATGALESTAVVVADVLTLDEAEVMVNITTTFSSNLDIIALESPEGTSVQIHDNNGSSAGINVLYDEDGDPTAGANYLCACAIQPSGPGDLTDYAGELSDGTWTLSLSSFTADTLTAWCVRLYGCPLLPPSSVACDAIGTDVTLSWVNDGVYSSIDILQDGALLATLAGTDTSFAITGLEIGRYRFQVLGTSAAAGCSAGSAICRAAVGFFEFCDTSGFDAAPGGSDAPFPVTFLDPIIVGDVDVVLEMAVSFTSDWDIFLESPFGTRLQLHNNNGGSGSFNLIWSDAGDTNTGAAGSYDCNLCLIQPIPPGDFGVFAGEVADGDWNLVLNSFATGSVEAWCLGIYEGCTVDPPGEILCASSGNDVEVTWSNSAAYDGVELHRNGIVVAELAGTATAYTDVGLLGGSYTYRVFGVSTAEGCASGSQLCLAEHKLTEICDATGLDFVVGVNSSTIAVVDPLPVLEVEIGLDITVGFVTDVQPITIESPGATIVTLYNATAGTGANHDCIISGSGIDPDFTTSYDCGGCKIQPTGPGFLSDFENQTADGDWTLEITDSFGSGGSLNEWCLRIFEGCAAAAPSGLTCTDDASSVELEWVNGETYDSVDVERNGTVIASLAGSPTSYSDEPLPGRYNYRVIGIVDSLDCGSRSNLCSVQFAEISTCDSPSLSLPVGTTTDTLDVADSVEIADVEAQLEYTTGFMASDLTVVLESPAATEVTLMALFGTGAIVDATIGDGGATPSSTTVYDCAGCLIAPTGPGALADFAGEISDGSWSLTTTVAFTTATLNEWCVDVYPSELAVEGALFLRGDASGNGLFNAMLDALFILNYQFSAGPTPPCFTAADCDGNNLFNALLDGLFILNYQFNAGAAPPAPGPTTCGPDPDGDADPLGCLAPDPVCNP